jgi:hypothetical protein
MSKSMFLRLNNFGLLKSENEVSMTHARTYEDAENIIRTVDISTVVTILKVSL